MYLKQKVGEGLRAYRESYGVSEFDRRTENELIKTALKGYTFFQLLWAGEWYRTQHPDESGTWVVELKANACLLNDYDSLFS